MKALQAWLRRPEEEPAASAAEPRLGAREILLLALTVLVARALAARAFPIYDDAFITYRYARNLAAGLGMVYNPGAEWEPILGTTTPGYTVLLAGLAWLGLPMIGASLAVNFLCDAVSAAVLVLLLGARRVPSVIAVLAFAAVPEIARISAGGMEPPVVVCCALLAVHAFQRDRMAASGLASAIACTLRPECVLLVLLLAALAWVQKRALLRFLAPVAVVGVAVAGALTLYYGHPIAHSIRAKTVVSGGEQHPGYSRVPDILAQAFGPSRAMLALLPLVALGAFVTFARRSRLMPFAAFALAIVVSYLIAQPKTWGWYFYAPMLAWAAWLGLGVEQLARWIGFARLRLSDRPALRALTALGCALAVVVVAFFPRLQADRITPRVYLGFARWAEEARLAGRRVTISASDIGAVGWYTNALVYDSAGLIWPEALTLPEQADQVRKYRPDYVVAVVRRARLAPLRLADPELTAAYRPIRRFNEVSETGKDQLDPDVAALPDRWKQDYLVYERSDLSEREREE